MKATTKELRQFGIMTGILIALIFGLFIPWLWNAAYFHWPWYVGGALFALGLAVPIALGPLYVAWMKLAHVLGWINTRIILGFVFYAIFVPVSLMFKLLGKDPLRRTLDRQTASYKKAPHHALNSNMEKPF